MTKRANSSNKKWVWYINDLKTLDLSSSDGAQCVDESEFDRQISHGINVGIAFLHHLSNSLHRKNMFFL